MRRTVRILAFIVLFGLVATACGARLDPNTRNEAANAVLNGGGGGVGGTGATGTGTGTTGSGTGTGTGGTSATGSTGTTGGTAGTKGTKGTQGSQGSSSTTGGTTSTNNGVTPGAKCPTSGTDVGLTSNQITLGTIADVTGPVPGLFTGARQGMAAFAAYVNNSGGLCGHQVVDKFADGGTNCSQNQNDVDSLAKSVFALVGTFSLYDGCGATEIKKFPTMPDIHVSLDPSAVAPANHFDLEPGHLGYATGMWAYYKKKLGTKVNKVGTIYENIPSAKAKQDAELHAAESQGWHFAYNIGESPTTSDFQSDFQKMCSNGVKLFFTVTEDAQNAATMISDENKVSSCRGMTNVIPIAYDQAFLTFCKQVGCGATENSILGWNEYSLFFNPAEANMIPELKLFQTWFQRVNPGQPANLYALFAWADGRLFQQAFQSAGSTANRRTVLSALGKISKYDDNGVMAPVSPGSKTVGATCFNPWFLRNGAFSRQPDNPKGFNCSGSYLQYNGS